MMYDEAINENEGAIMEIKRPKESDLLKSVKNIIGDMMSEGDISPTFKVYILTDDQWNLNVSRAARKIVTRVVEELDPPKEPKESLPTFPADDDSLHFFIAATGENVLYQRRGPADDIPWTLGDKWISSKEFAQLHPEMLPLTKID